MGFGTSGTSLVPFDPFTGSPHLDVVGDPLLWIDGTHRTKDTLARRNVFEQRSADF